MRRITRAPRAELERFGGRVEKFIGDAVMAVFGAPAAHEDDAERAVRGALAVRDAFVEEGLDVRIAVNTGEALVLLSARPEAGEAMVAGDVVNTAARLQSAAPVNGVLVGEATRRATERAIEYREAPVGRREGQDRRRSPAPRRFVRGRGTASTSRSTAVPLSSDARPNAVCSSTLSTAPGASGRCSS